MKEQYAVRIPQAWSPNCFTKLKATNMQEAVKEASQIVDIFACCDHHGTVYLKRYDPYDERYVAILDYTI